MTIAHAELHWLNILERIEYKLGVMVYRCLHDRVNTTINGLIADHLIPASDAAPHRLRLRSANQNRLAVPHYRLITSGWRAFYHAGLTVWNLLRLPDVLSGCLQLLEILEISLNLYGPPGNFV